MRDAFHPITIPKVSHVARPLAARSLNRDENFPFAFEWRSVFRVLSFGALVLCNGTFDQPIRRRSNGSGAAHRCPAKASENGSILCACELSIGIWMNTKSTEEANNIKKIDLNVKRSICRNINSTEIHIPPFFSHMFKRLCSEEPTPFEC